MQLIEIKNIKNGSSEVHCLLIGRIEKFPFTKQTLNLDRLEESPSLDSGIMVQDPLQKFQPNSLPSWGIPAIATASRNEQFNLNPGHGTVMAGTR